MGQAFRRASGRIRATDPSPTAKSVRERRPPVGTTEKVNISRRTAQYNNQDSLDSVMYATLMKRLLTSDYFKIVSSFMLWAAVVERYNRPMPKLRNTKPDSGRYEERPAPQGTLNVAQLRHIMLLHQGKADDHNGPMDIHQIAKKFRLEVAQVEQILQYVYCHRRIATNRKVISDHRLSLLLC
ncbi:hypothetical protein GH714_018616 [Hevea brasiliensis]|uniref:Uncharacterized protein n=1 Tax=Hevea brasiliensis TaxID=3981 RepID=A0A6A6MPQ1_HEVBR|nr:hypothetical protein GH714_018616 [Hevea brasiliensis]